MRVADEASPEASAVLLAADAPGEDGLLQVDEITRLDLRGSLVALSSCRSASGALLGGEGVMSLSRAFFAAGSATVIGSLWPVRDDDAEAFFAVFYDHLAAGETASAAFSAAQRERLEDGAPAQAWAGFVLSGHSNGASLPARKTAPGTLGFQRSSGSPSEFSSSQPSLFGSLAFADEQSGDADRSSPSQRREAPGPTRGFEGTSVLMTRRTIMLSLRKLKTAALLLAALTPAAWAQEPAEPPQARTVLLAKFHLANGNTVHLWSLPDVDEIMIGEVTKAGPSEQFFLKPETHPVEVFRLLAPKNSPVPRAIAQIDHDKVFEGRKLVNALHGTIEVPMSRLGLTTLPTQKAGGGSCEPGDGDGADYFEDHHCYTLGGPGYGSSEQYCFKNSADWIQKTSDDQRRATYTRMAVCGTAPQPAAPLL